MLPEETHPAITTVRQVSKWETDPYEQDLNLNPARYHSGHYVPPWKRSEWSRAQYTVYKEEQAPWRKDLIGSDWRV
jgi:hypothetical protein